MQFSSFSEFFAMGGYGFYVWLSYGTCAVILLTLLITSVRNHKNTLTAVSQQLAREARISKAKESANES
jgi:heme exporter protein D